MPKERQDQEAKELVEDDGEEGSADAAPMGTDEGGASRRLGGAPGAARPLEGGTKPRAQPKRAIKEAAAVSRAMTTVHAKHAAGHAR